MYITEMSEIANQLQVLRPYVQDEAYYQAVVQFWRLRTAKSVADIQDLVPDWSASKFEMERRFKENLTVLMEEILRRNSLCNPIDEATAEAIINELIYLDPYANSPGYFKEKGFRCQGHSYKAVAYCRGSPGTDDQVRLPIEGIFFVRCLNTGITKRKPNLIKRQD